jgi:hypothetical protein
MAVATGAGSSSGSGGGSQPGSRQASTGGAKPPSAQGQSRLGSSQAQRSTRGGRSVDVTGGTATRPAPAPHKIAGVRDAASSARPSPQQAAAEERLRQELALRRQQEALLREQRGKEDAARSAVAAMQKDMKGREYGYDRSGKVVLLARANPDALPTTPAPGARIAAPAPAPNAASTATAGKLPSLRARQQSPPRAAGEDSTTNQLPAGKPGGSSSGVGEGVAMSKGGNSSTRVQDFVEVPSRAQPSALETLKPGVGVVLRAGAAVKQGPRTAPVAGQLTRTQYQQAAKTAAQQERNRAASVLAAQQQAAAAAAAAAGPIGAAGTPTGSAARGYRSAGSTTQGGRHPRSGGASASGPTAGLSRQASAAAAVEGQSPSAGDPRGPKPPGATVADILSSLPSSASPLLGAGKRESGSSARQQQQGALSLQLDVNLALTKVGGATMGWPV